MLRRASGAWAKHWPACAAVLLMVAALLPGWLGGSAAPNGSASVAARRHVEWPQQWDGETLRPLGSTAVEQRFAQRFPGTIARFAAGPRVLVLRHVEAPTRMLHPAADCFRGLGYRIERSGLERDAQQRLWRCFEAVSPQGERLRVCERIAGDDGSAFTDASAWFWSAALGASRGPWQAVTLVEVL